MKTTYLALSLLAPSLALSSTDTTKSNWTISGTQEGVRYVTHGETVMILVS